MFGSHRMSQSSPGQIRLVKDNTEGRVQIPASPCAACPRALTSRFLPDLRPDGASAQLECKLSPVDKLVSLMVWLHKTGCPVRHYTNHDMVRESLSRLGLTRCAWFLSVGLFDGPEDTMIIWFSVDGCHCLSLVVVMLHVI